MSSTMTPTPTQQHILQLFQENDRAIVCDFPRKSGKTTALHEQMRRDLASIPPQQRILLLYYSRNLPPSVLYDLRHRHLKLSPADSARTHMVRIRDASSFWKAIAEHPFDVCLVYVDEFCFAPHELQDAVAAWKGAHRLRAISTPGPNRAKENVND
jgi:hypothetical protein